ncbi:MAG: monofunctional biosynthetic peptidoglycan transglycosylase [Desulfobacter sp.]|nr:monofunctional biosynthetic peptidoglycan transglycosylase [Desulfobacter sp.]
MKKKTKNKFRTWIIKTGVKLCLTLIVLSFCQVLAFKFFNPPGTVNMVYEWARSKCFDVPYLKANYKWQDLEDISPHLRQAVLASEDQRFLTHNGFDFKEIQNAISQVMNHHGFRGASTISMQAARSVFLPSSRSIARKLSEAWYTILIELIWDKKRILEIYLNTVDWGTGIVGAQAGARAYFSSDAKDLTMGQAALMTAILPSPHKWSARNPSVHVIKRKKWILSQMKAMPLL